MCNVLNRFLHDDNGAVTVDFVVLTAMVIGLGVVVITTIAQGALDHSTGLGAHLLAEEVTTTF